MGKGESLWGWLWRVYFALSPLLSLPATTIKCAALFRQALVANSAVTDQGLMNRGDGSESKTLSVDV